MPLATCGVRGDPTYLTLPQLVGTACSKIRSIWFPPAFHAAAAAEMSYAWCLKDTEEKREERRERRCEKTDQRDRIETHTPSAGTHHHSTCTNMVSGQIGSGLLGLPQWTCYLLYSVLLPRILGSV